MTMPVLLKHKVICVMRDYRNSYSAILSLNAYVMWKTRVPGGSIATVDLKMKID